MEQAARSIGLYINLNKTEFMCFNQYGTISPLNSTPLKYVGPFIYLGSNIASIESDVNKHTGKAWAAIDRLLTIWKSDLSEEIK